MRTETVEYKIYTFDELSDDAKQNAIDRARHWNVEDTDWYDGDLEDFQNILSILGFEVETKDILFRGFSCQGDGLSFTGYYGYQVKSPQRIREYAPLQTELHDIADQLAAIQKRYFYMLTGNISRHYRCGNYVHENTVGFSLDYWRTDCPNLPDDVCNIEESIEEQARRLMQVFYTMLNDQYDYPTSDETVAETLRVNEYEFTENGEIY